MDCWSARGCSSPVLCPHRALPGGARLTANPPRLLRIPARLQEDAVSPSRHGSRQMGRRRSTPRSCHGSRPRHNPAVALCGEVRRRAARPRAVECGKRAFSSCRWAALTVPVDGARQVAIPSTGAGSHWARDGMAAVAGTVTERTRRGCDRRGARPAVAARDGDPSRLRALPAAHRASDSHRVARARGWLALSPRFRAFVARSVGSNA
jgi:hypothetical protein